MTSIFSEGSSSCVAGATPSTGTNGRKASPSASPRSLSPIPPPTGAPTTPPLLLSHAAAAASSSAPFLNGKEDFAGERLMGTALQRLVDKLRQHQPFFLEDDTVMEPASVPNSASGGGSAPPLLPPLIEVKSEEMEESLLSTTFTRGPRVDVDARSAASHGLQWEGLSGSGAAEARVRVGEERYRGVQLLNHHTSSSFASSPSGSQQSAENSSHTSSPSGSQGGRGSELPRGDEGCLSARPPPQQEQQSRPRPEEGVGGSSVERGGGGASQTSQTSQGGKTTSSPGSSGGPSMLSPPVFSTAVSLLDPALLTRNKRTGLEVLKLIRSGCEWICRKYVPPSSGTSAATMASSSSLIPGLPPSFALLFQTEQLSPAARHHLRRLDEAIQSLLVYTNEGVGLRQHITSHEPTLRLLCAVCSAMRKVDREEELQQQQQQRKREKGVKSSVFNASQHEFFILQSGRQTRTAGNKRSRSPRSLTPPFSSSSRGNSRTCSGGEEGSAVGEVVPSGPSRSMATELSLLLEVWGSCGMTSAGRLADLLLETYQLEYLLDAALPPAVCSAKYEGLHLLLAEKKGRIVSDLVNSRLAGVFHPATWNSLSSPTVVGDQWRSRTSRVDGAGAALLASAAPPPLCSNVRAGAVEKGVSEDLNVVPVVEPSSSNLFALQCFNGLIRLSASAEPRVRVRLLDRLAVEVFVVERLEQQLFAVCEQLHHDLDDRNDRQRSASIRIGGPTAPHYSQSGNGNHSSGKRPRAETQQWITEVVRRANLNEEGDKGEAGAEGARRSKYPLPTTRNRSWIAALSLCLEILQVLTQPDQRPPWEEGGPESPTASSLVFSTGSAAPMGLRATQWAEHEVALQGILSALLWLLVHLHDGRSQSAVPVATPSVGGIEEPLYDCLVQLAGFSLRLDQELMRQLELLRRGRLVLRRPLPLPSPPPTSRATSAGSGLFPALAALSSRISPSSRPSSNTNASSAGGGGGALFPSAPQPHLPPFPKPNPPSYTTPAEPGGALRTSLQKKSGAALQKPLEGRATTEVKAMGEDGEVEGLARASNTHRRRRGRPLRLSRLRDAAPLLPLLRALFLQRHPEAMLARRESFLIGWLDWLGKHLLCEAFGDCWCPRDEKEEEEEVALSACWEKVLKPLTSHPPGVWHTSPEARSGATESTSSNSRDGTPVSLPAFYFPVLVRPLTRREVLSLSPYFTFVNELVQQYYETRSSAPAAVQSFQRLLGNTVVFQDAGELATAAHLVDAENAAAASNSTPPGCVPLPSLLSSSSTPLSLLTAAQKWESEEWRRWLSGPPLVRVWCNTFYPMNSPLETYSMKREGPDNNPDVTMRSGETVPLLRVFLLKMILVSQMVLQQCARRRSAPLYYGQAATCLSRLMELAREEQPGGCASVLQLELLKCSVRATAGDGAWAKYTADASARSSWRVLRRLVESEEDSGEELEEEGYCSVSSANSADLTLSSETEGCADAVETEPTRPLDGEAHCSRKRVRQSPCLLQKEWTEEEGRTFSEPTNESKKREGNTAKFSRSSQKKRRCSSTTTAEVPEAVLLAESAAKSQLPTPAPLPEDRKESSATTQRRKENHRSLNRQSSPSGARAAVREGEEEEVLCGSSTSASPASSPRLLLPETPQDEDEEEKKSISHTPVRGWGLGRTSSEGGNNSARESTLLDKSPATLTQTHFSSLHRWLFRTPSPR